MNKLILTVGLPRSGKSTWAKKQNLPIVNRDAIRLAVHGHKYIQEAEGFISAIEEAMVKSLFLAGNTTVILDSCNLKEEYRKRWKTYPYHKLQWEIQLEYFCDGKDVCIQRAIADERDDLIPIIESMAKPEYK